MAQQVPDSGVRKRLVIVSGVYACLRIPGDTNDRAPLDISGQGEVMPSLNPEDSVEANCDSHTAPTRLPMFTMPCYKGPGLRFGGFGCSLCRFCDPKALPTASLGLE